MSSPRAFPQNRVWCFGGFSFSSYDVKHSFLPMGSKLDSRQFGLLGRRESLFRYWPDLPVSVDRAAARPRHGHAAHNQSSLSTDHRVVRISCLVVRISCVSLSCTYLGRMIGNSRSTYRLARSSQRASLPPASAFAHSHPSFSHGCASARSGRARTLIFAIPLVRLIVLQMTRRSARGGYYIYIYINAKSS